MSKTETDWSLLARDPRTFFALPDAFDRKQLKRAYGNWIKRYKPESHPAEFQRIREAYELLERGQRYGATQLRQSNLEAAWQSDSAASTGSKAGNSVTAAVRDPKGTYAELSRSSDRTPQDYFVLATLSDLVDKQTGGYVKWVFAGLKHFPDDPGLLRLAAEYLSAFVTEDNAANLLVTLAKILSSGDFFRITEQLWFRLAGKWAFADFAKVLSACEKQLRGDNTLSRIAFNIQLLRRLVWTAPRQWVDQRVAWLDAHGSYLSDAANEEFEFLQMLLQYCRSEREQAQATQAGQLLDQMITTYCQQSGMHAVRKVALIADELARSGNAIVDGFPYTNDELETVAPFLGQAIAAEIADDLGIDFEPANEQRIEQQAGALVSDLHASFESAGSRIGRTRTYYRVVPFLAIWLGPIILLYGWSMQLWLVGSLFWTPIALALTYFVVMPRWVTKKLDSRTQNIVAAEYQNVWRPRLYRYLAACNAPAETCIEALIQAAHFASSEQLADITLSYAQSDPFIHLFSRLQVFVR